MHRNRVVQVRAAVPQPQERDGRESGLFAIMELGGPMHVVARLRGSSRKPLLALANNLLSLFFLFITV